MPKRKRESPEESDNGAGDKAQGIKQLRAEQKLGHGQKLLTRAFKTARGFERQKLGRRHKTATSSSKSADAERINAEVTALKTLDLPAVAATYLHKSLLKYKSVAQSTDLPRSLTKPAHQPTDPAALNVIARMCNSNPVREAITPIVKEITRALGISIEGPGMKAKRVRAKDISTKKAPGQSKQVEDESEDESEDEDDDGQNVPVKRKKVDALDDGDEDSDDFADFDARIAGSSDEGSDEDGPDFRRASSDEGEDGAADLLSLDGSELDDSDVSDSEEPSKGKANKRKALSPSPSASDSDTANPPPPKKTTKSDFLPSLTMGGYISGSESGDDPFDNFDDSANKPKKNRRGQRARQAIWEKKFGQGAKHLTNEERSNASKDKRGEGWDAKRGATDRRNGASGRGGRGGMGGRGGRTMGTAAASGANTEAKKKHRDDEGALHPSWAAAKKAKEAKNAPVAFAGKKITFD